MQAAQAKSFRNILADFGIRSTAGGQSENRVIKTDCFPSTYAVLSDGAGRGNLSFINIAASSNGFYFNSFTFRINLVNDSDTTHFISVFTLELAVQLFDMWTEKRLSAENIDTLVKSSLCVAILFLIIFVGLVGD
jgi:hypothetical protein